MAVVANQNNEIRDIRGYENMASEFGQYPRKRLSKHFSYAPLVNLYIII
jgi:hypothetical protein